MGHSKTSCLCSQKIGQSNGKRSRQKQTNQKKLYESLYGYIPIGNHNLKIIGDEVREIVRANTLGIPLVAFAQGVVALIGFLIFGVDNALFWAIMVTIGSMIPFVGNLLGT